MPIVTAMPVRKFVKPNKHKPHHAPDDPGSENVCGTKTKKEKFLLQLVVIFLQKFCG